MTLTHKDIIDYCNYLINKDQTADPISPNEYNAIIPIVNAELYTREKKRLIELSGGVHMKFVELLRESYLQDIKNMYTIVNAANPQTVNGDVILTVRGLTTNGGVKIDIVSEDKAFEMASGLYDQSDAIYGWKVGRQLYFSANLSSFSYIYLDIPQKPYFDYYIDSQSNVKYLLPGWKVIANGQGGLKVQDTMNNDVDNHILYPVTPRPSQSVEFQWRDSVLTTLVNLIFEKMSINIREQMPVEISQLKKQEVE